MCVFVCVCVFVCIFTCISVHVPPKAVSAHFHFAWCSANSCPASGPKKVHSPRPCGSLSLAPSLADPLLANECSKSSLLGVELSQPDGCLAVWVAAWLIVKVISDLIFQMVAHTKCRRSRLRKGRGHAPIVGYCIRQCRQFVKALTVFLTFFLFYDLFLFFASIHVSFLHSCIVSSFSSSCRVFCAF